MNRLKNKNIFISGATSGIGEACALQLAALGANLILCARSETKLQVLKSELESEGTSVTTILLDVRDRAAVESALTMLLEHTPIDILINNAGLARGLEPLDAGDVDAWEQMIDTNVKGLLYVSRTLFSHMRQRNSGHIVNLGSIAGHMTYSGGNVYCATKAAVHALSEAMNLDTAGTEIRVSNVAPGAVETNFSNIRFNGDDAKADAVYEGYEPLKAEDIADLIVYILNAPAHVNIQQTLVMPTAQRNPFVLARKP